MKMFLMMNYQYVVNRNVGMTESKYAVKKSGNKRALRVYDSLEEAERHINSIKEEERKNFEIETRLGEDRRCLNYCSCCHFCSYYRDRYERG